MPPPVRYRRNADRLCAPASHLRHTNLGPPPGRARRHHNLVAPVSIRAVPALLVALSAAASAVPAQEAPSGPAPRRADRSIGVWAAASVATADRWGTITDRHFYVTAVRVQYLLETVGHFAIASTIDLVPLAVLSNTPTYYRTTVPASDGRIVDVRIENGRTPVLGAGVLPAGLQLYTSSRRTRLFLGASAGVIWFTRNTPIPDARRMNLALDFGGGAELIARNRRVLVLGYKYQHLSNAGTARLNPGVDTHLVSFGIMRR